MITIEYLQFFRELAVNNHRDWFAAHKDEYEEFVKQPFERLVAEIIEDSSKIEPAYKALTPKDCIYRINRDIRFSKDKTPYKLNRSALLSNEGRKAFNEAGFFFDVGVEKVLIGVGSYMPSKDDLWLIRNKISENLNEFDGIIKNKKFVSTFGEIIGEENKIIPKEFKESAKVQPLIFKKQFYTFAEYDSEELIAKNAVNASLFVSHLKTGKALNDFLNSACS